MDRKQFKSLLKEGFVSMVGVPQQMHMPVENSACDCEPGCDCDCNVASSNHDPHHLEDTLQDHMQQEHAMLKSELLKMHRACEELCSMISDNEELPAWIQQKIAVAASMVDAVHHYMDYKHSGK